MRKIRGLFIVLMAFSFLFLKVEVKARFITLTQIIMTTQVTVIADAPLWKIQRAFEEIKKINSLMNDYNPRSEVGILNRKGEIKASPEVKEVILRALYFSRITNGAFDITVGPLVRLWQRMGIEKRLPTSRELMDALSLVGYKYVKVKDDRVSLEKKGMRIDLGGIAKGYAVDKAIKVLKREGVKDALVNAGGDMYCMGNGPHGRWRIGVQHPRKDRGIVDILEVTDKAVATSGDYQRYYIIQGKRFGHIISPSTGWTVQNNPMSVTIIAPDCTSADALATGIFVLGPEKGIELIENLPGIEGMIISRGMKMVKSGGWREFEVKD